MTEVIIVRKYLVGFVAGFLLASAFPAYGAVSSLVGKQVQAENTVIVNGKELDIKAVNIDGTTFAPNRAIAEALGLDINFVDGAVIFENKEGDPVEDSMNPINEDHGEYQIEGYTIETITDAINNYSGSLEGAMGILRSIEKKGFPQDAIDELRNGIEEMKRELERLNSIKSKLEERTQTK